MACNKGIKHYPQALKEAVREDRKQGASLRSLSKKHEVSKYSVQSWCGLRPEVELCHAAPLPKGCPVTKPDTQEQIIKRLKMENGLAFIALVVRVAMS
ncbi:MAG: hypothetical protein RR284_10945 [Ruthenibacterium sp.]